MAGAGARRQSISSVITISQPPSDPADKSARYTGNPTMEMTFTPTNPDVDVEELHPEDLDIEELSLDMVMDEAGSGSEAEMSDASVEKVKDKEKEENRMESLKILEGEEKGASRRRSKHRKTASGANAPAADAVIVLKEERASTFHDFLKFVYPQYVVSILNFMFTYSCTLLYLIFFV